MKKIFTFVMLGFFTGAFVPVLAEPYAGKLRCASLNQLMGSQPGLEVGRFCRAALDRCGVMDMINKNIKVPFVAQAKPAIEQLINNELTICEIAILNHDPEYYAENLKR